MTPGVIARARGAWLSALSLLALAVAPLPASAETAPPPTTRWGPGPRPVLSPEIHADRRVTFRIRAPKAERVSIESDFARSHPAPPQVRSTGAPRTASPPPPALILTKGADGIWSGKTRDPVPPGAYRYVFNVDGVMTMDQTNLRASASQWRHSSLLVIPGDFSEQRAVPHGAVSEINYEPTVYVPGTQRRLWVYTPPGYETGRTRYPVLYLIHGGGDSGQGWPTIGRANFIVDNLLAERRAVPFIMVMMTAWTPHGAQTETIDAANDPFNAELTRDIIPLIEKRYRVKPGSANRALSGLSMGGFQTLTIGMKNIDLFDYVLPMSTGWYNEEDRAAFVKANRAAIERADKRLRLFRWGWGETDTARENGLEGIAALRTAGMNRIEAVEVPGGHQWSSWRILLHDFAPRLFR